MRLSTLFSLSTLFLQSAAFAALPIPVEMYFYINGDNDLITLDKDGKTIHQGEVVFDQLSQLAEQLGEGSAFHLYYDPNDKIAGAKYQQTLIRHFLDGKLASEELLGETNSADPAMLSRLLGERRLSGVEYARALVFWGHGDGWKDISSYDFSHPEQGFSYLDQGEVLKSAELDLLVFDTCRMATVEALSALSGSAKLIMASQFNLPVKGISYRNLAVHIAGIQKELVEKQALEKMLFLRLLYKVLNIDTVEDQRAEKIFAPLVLYSGEAFEGFRDTFNRVVLSLAERGRKVGAAEWEKLVRASRSADDSIDLRALIHHSKNILGFDASEALKAYSGLSYRGYGSVQFFLPERLGESSSQPSSSKPWALRLENWRI